MSYILYTISLIISFILLPAYSKDLKNLLAEEMARLVSLQQKVDNFRLQLVNEEQISQKMKRPSQLPMRYNYNN